MHRVLYVQELLLNIFGHCYEHVDGYCIGKENLAALARTCKTFKELALDILWAELEDLTPLVRCLPEASCLSSFRLYSLKRPLQQVDWDVILGYTHRVRICRLPNLFGLSADCIEELSKPPTTITSIFPRLFEVEIYSPGQEIVPFLRHLAGPTLTTLRFRQTRCIEAAIDAFWDRCPNITTFDYVPHLITRPASDKISGLICQWPKLRYVCCMNIALNVAAFTHLSHRYNLHFLSFDLCNPVVSHIRSILPLPSTLTFPALVHHELHSQFLDAVWRLFYHLSLPAIKLLRIDLDTHPTTEELMSFFSALPKTCDRQLLTDVGVHVLGFEEGAMYGEFVPDGPPYYINSHHLRPLAVFTNIQTIYLDLPCGVDLSEPELLRLASSWPHLGVFVVGWGECQSTPSSAITPEGFIQLLERCRSLYEFSFLFNTDGYTEIPQGHPWRGLEMPEDAVIDVRKSPIEEESIEALAVFFHAAPFSDIRLKNTWDDYSYSRSDEYFTLAKLYDERWDRVCSLARKLWEERDNLLDSLESRRPTTD